MVFFNLEKPLAKICAFRRAKADRSISTAFPEGLNWFQSEFHLLRYVHETSNPQKLVRSLLRIHTV